VLKKLMLVLFVPLLAWCPPIEEMTTGEIWEKVEAATYSSLVANIAYTRTDPILERREIRTGRILIRKREDKKDEVAFLFDTLIIGRRKESRKKHYIISGRWLAEIDVENKQFIKHQLSPEHELYIVAGEHIWSVFEYLTFVEYPKKHGTVEFDITRVSRPNDGPLSSLDESIVGLHWVAKDDFEYAYESIDFFYNPTTWLLEGIHSVEKDGTTRSARFTNVQIDSLSEEDAKLLSIETPDPKEWSIDIRPWQGD